MGLVRPRHATDSVMPRDATTRSTARLVCARHAVVSLLLLLVVHGYGVATAVAAGAGADNVPQVEDLAWIRLNSGEAGLGPVGTRINALTVGPGGSLWVGTDQGLGQFRDGRFTTFQRMHGLPDENVFDLAVWGLGVAAATPRGVVWVPEWPGTGQVVRLLSPTNSSIASIVVDERRLWFCGLAGDESARPLLGNASLLPENVPAMGTFTAANPVQDGRPTTRMLAGPPGFILRSDNRGRWEWWGPAQNTTSPTGPTLAHANSGLALRIEDASVPTTYLVMSNGVWRAGSITNLEPLFTATNGPISAIARAWFPAKGVVPALWLASEGEVTLLDGAGTLRKRYRTPGRPSVTSIAQDFTGRLWLGTDLGLFVADPQRASLPSPAVPRSNDSASPDGGKTPDDTLSTEATAGFTESGVPWVLTDSRLYLLREQGWNPVASSPDVKGKTKGWVGSLGQGNLARIDERRFRQWRSNDWDGGAEFPSSYLESQLEADLVRWEIADSLLAKLKELKAPEVSRFLSELSPEKQNDLERGDELLATLTNHLGAQWPRSLTALGAVSLQESSGSLLAASPDGRLLVTKLANGSLGFLRLADGSWTALETQDAWKAIRQAGATSDGSVILAITEYGRIGAFVEGRWTLLPAARSDLILPEPDLDFGLGPDSGSGDERRSHLPFQRHYRAREGDLQLFGARSDRILAVLHKGRGIPVVTNILSEIYRQNRTEPRASKGPIVLGALADPDGHGLLLGFWRTNPPLLHLRDDPPPARRTPAKVDDDKLGCGGNAFLRDFRGREWVAGTAKLWKRDRPTEIFEAFEPAGDSAMSHVNAMLEYPPGKLWFASSGGGGGGVWTSTNGEAAQRLETPAVTYTRLCLQITADGQTNLWASGQKTTLLRIDPQSGEVVTNLTRSLTEFLRSRDITDATILGLVADGPDLLFNIGPRLFRRTESDWSEVPLPDPGVPLADGSDLVGYAVRLRDGRIVLAIRVQDAAAVWTKEPGPNPFQLVFNTPESVVITPTHDDSGVLIVTSAQKVFRLKGTEVVDLHWDVGTPDTDPSEVIPATRKNPLPPTPLVSIAALGDGSYLVLGRNEGPYRVEYSKSPDDPPLLGTRLPFPLPPWSTSIELATNRLLLVHSNALSLLNLSDLAAPTNRMIRQITIPGAGSAERIHAIALPPGGNTDSFYLAAGDAIWFSDGSSPPTRICSTPVPATELAGGDCELAIDEEGMWLASGTRLWRGRLGPVPDWQAPLGGALQGIKAIAPRGPHHADVLAIDGLLQLNHQPYPQTNEWWTFETRNTLAGVAGTPVTVVEAFTHAGHSFLAVGTPSGLSLARWPNTAPLSSTNATWTYLDSGRNLLDNNVTALAWNPGESNLLVGTAAGINQVTFESTAGGPLVPRVTRESFSQLHGFPKDRVPRQIRASADGDRLWVLVGPPGEKPTATVLPEFFDENSRPGLNRRGRNGGGSRNGTVERPAGYRLLLWQRGHPGPDHGGVLVDTASYLLASALDARLGPVSGEGPPPVLLRDASGRWTRWDVDKYHFPRLTAEQGLFRPHCTVRIDSLAGTCEANDTWKRIAEPDWRRDTADDGDHGWFTGLLSEGDERIRVEQLQSPDQSTYYASVVLPRLTTAEKIVRFGLPAAAAVLALGWAGLRWKNKRQRHARLRLRENPYIVGRAITQPEQCYGRRDLLENLKNTIRTTNWALLGEFRIGKTTLQYQLRSILDAVESHEVVFLPVMLDLQNFWAGGGKHLFYWLGRGIRDFAHQRGVADSVLNGLEVEEEGASETYDGVSLGRDVDVLIEAWKETYAPRDPILVLQIDEVQILGELDYRILSGFRALLVGRDNVRAVLSGVSLPKRTGQELSPWWNIFRELQVIPLTPAESRALITQPVRGLFYFDEAAIQLLSALSENKPLRLQQLCSDVLTYKYENNFLRSPITEAEVKASLGTTHLAPTPLPPHKA